MGLKLTVKERMKMFELFPQRADMQTQAMVRDIVEKVRVTQEEEGTLKIERTPGPNGTTNLVWDEKQAKLLDINFSKAEGRFLKNRVDEKDRAQDITQDQLSLCEKIRSAEIKPEEESEG